jgi:hypothetical protein
MAMPPWWTIRIATDINVVILSIFVIEIFLKVCQILFEVLGRVLVRCTQNVFFEVLFVAVMFRVTTATTSTRHRDRCLLSNYRSQVAFQVF